MEIEGKVIIITGGAAGIGAGLAERFHQDLRETRTGYDLTQRHMAVEPL